MQDVRPQVDVDQESGGAPRGLRHASGSVVSDLKRPRRRPAVRIGLQLVGFVISIAIFAWILSIALSPENREALLKLREAGPGPPAAVAGLTAVSVLLNGLIFWALIRPVARLDAAGVIAINAICMAIAYLPFKLSVVARALLHRRRDHLPYKALIAWIGGAGGLSLAVLVQIGVFGGLLVDIDAIAWAALLAGSGLVALATILMGRLAVSKRALHAITLGAGDMLREPKAVAPAVAMRVADIVAQAARFSIVASVLGHELALGDAAVLAVTFIAVGALAPTGMLGLREGAVFGIGSIALRTGVSESELATIALAVSAAEAVTHLAVGAIAAVWLRPDRLLRRGGGTVTRSGAPA